MRPERQLLEASCKGGCFFFVANEHVEGFELQSVSEQVFLQHGRRCQQDVPSGSAAGDAGTQPITAAPRGPGRRTQEPVGHDCCCVRCE
jgi:hypothetical protein